MKNPEAPAVKREKAEEVLGTAPWKQRVPTLRRTARWLEHRQVCRHFTVHGRCQLGWLLCLFGHFRPLLRELKPTAPYWRVSSERGLNSARLCLRTIQLHPRIHLNLPYPLRCAHTNIEAADVTSRRLKSMGSHAPDARHGRALKEIAHYGAGLSTLISHKSNRAAGGTPAALRPGASAQGRWTGIIFTSGRFGQDFSCYFSRAIKLQNARRRSALGDGGSSPERLDPDQRRVSVVGAFQDRIEGGV